MASVWAQSLWNGWRQIGLLAQIGVWVIALGLVFDLAAHATAGGSEQLLGFTLPEHFAHAVVLGGMLIALFGLVRQGRHNGRSRTAH